MQWLLRAVPARPLPPAEMTPMSQHSSRAAAEDDHWLRRRRLERRLHDGAALRLAALSLQLGVLRHRAPQGSGLQDDIAAVQDELHAVLEELRHVAGEIHPPLLAEAGLGAALAELAGSVGYPVGVSAPADRYRPAVEAAAYLAVVAALAEPGTVGRAVAVGRDGDELVLELAHVPVALAGPIAAQVRCLDGRVAVRADRAAPGDSVPTSSVPTSEITVRIPCG